MKIGIIGAGTWGIVVASYLSKKNHEITVYHRDSETSRQLIRNHEHPHLAGKSIPENIKYNILDSTMKILTKDGVFIQYQYSLNAKKLLKSKFEKVNVDFTALNLPPAFIYHCRN